MKTKFEDLPEDVQTAICDINAHLNIASACIEDPDVFVDAKKSLNAQVKNALLILGELFNDQAVAGGANVLFCLSIDKG